MHVCLHVCISYLYPFLPALVVVYILTLFLPYILLLLYLYLHTSPCTHTHAYATTHTCPYYQMLSFSAPP